MQILYNAIILKKIADSLFFLTKTNNMELSLKLDEKLLYDSSQFRNLVADTVPLDKLHVFLRKASHAGYTGISNIHTQFIIWVCLKGCGHLLIDNTAFVVKENEAMLTFPGQPHLRLPLKNHEVDWLLIRFESTRPEWFEILRNKLLSLTDKSLTYLREFIECYQEVRRNPENTDNSECFYWLGLLLSSLRNCKFDHGDEIHSVIEKSKEDYVKHACQLMMSGKLEQKSLTRIAKQLCISPGHLRAVFKASIGYSPRKVMQNFKISTAEHLLVHSNLNITQIAEKLQFGSVYSFSRFFKKHAGISPNQYRKQFR